MASTDPLYNDLLPIESRASMGARPQATQAITPATTLSTISGALPQATPPAAVPMEQAALQNILGTSPTAALQAPQQARQAMTPLDFFMSLLSQLRPTPDPAPGASPANSAQRYPAAPSWLFGVSPLDRRGDLFGVSPSQAPSQAPSPEEIRRRNDTLGVRG